MTGNEWALILTALFIGLAFGALSVRAAQRRLRLEREMILAEIRADEAELARLQQQERGDS